MATACDEQLESPSEPVAQCEAFDERCLHCEALGEGAQCSVGEDVGTCTEMRIIQGPQVYIAGLRCREN